MAPPRKGRKTKSDESKPSSIEQDDYQHWNQPDVDVNSRTGRPVRRSAGRRSLNSGFLNPDEAMTDSDQNIYVEDEDDHVRVVAKRKRSVSPPATPPHMIGQDTPDSSCGFTQELSRRHIIPPISLTFNVPPGHTGPFVVNLDINSLLSQVQSVMDPVATDLPAAQALSSADSGYSSKSSVASEQSKPAASKKTGFLDLPAEIRNQVYRLAFVSKEKLDFAYPNNFSRTSALLRTCRQIHNEGRSILYSENVFYLQRRKKERAIRWTTNSYEIGYKDIRYFLKNIGSINLSLLRHLVIMFEDAQPSMNPHLKDADDRRFTCDEDLLDMFRPLAEHSMLKTLDICFQGRRQFYSRDEPRFVEHLARIKADNVNFIDNPDTPYSGWRGSSKIFKTDSVDLSKRMTRAVPIFC